MAKMGADFHKSQWGWDNEFPSYGSLPLHFSSLNIFLEEFVDGFEMDEVPVTNNEFIQFIENGQYDNPSNWEPLDWEWKEKNNKKHPSSLIKDNGKWKVTKPSTILKIEIRSSQL